MTLASGLRVALARLAKWISLLLPAALASYGAWTFSGLYALLSRAQMSTFGAYASVISWLVAFLVVLVPLVLLLGAVSRRAGLPFDGVRLDISPAARNWIRRNAIALIGPALMAGGVISGLYFLIDGMAAGELSAVSAEELYRGGEPATRYVDLAGTPLRSAKYMVGVGGSALSSSGPRPDYFYFPIVPAAWKEGDSVRVVVKSFDEQPSSPGGSADQPNRLRGRLRRGSRGFVQQALSGKVTLASRSWILDETMLP